MNPKSHKSMGEIPKPKPNPAQDGVTHINAHSQGRTELGRQLSQSHHAPFTHPIYGPFWCVEGFIQYVRSGFTDDQFRTMSGHRVKEYAKVQRETKAYAEKIPKNLYQVIMATTYVKIDENKDLQKLLVESTLAFDHYYLFGPQNHLIRPKGAIAIAADLERLRTMFRNGETLNLVSDYEIIFPS